MIRTQVIHLFITLVMIFAAQPVWALTLSERLGFGPGDKVLLLHADDLGMIDTSNEAARDLFAFGLVKSGSVMTQSPYAHESFASVLRAAKGDLGLHLSLLGEGGWRPAAGAANVPSLVDRSGFLFDGVFDLLFWARDQDVTLELEAQIQSAVALGFHPSHLDTHFGSAFFKPSWFRSYLNLARKYRIPPMVPRWSEDLKEIFGRAGTAVERFIPGILDQVGKAGYLQLDYLYIFRFPSTDEGYEKRKKLYVDLLKRLKPGVTEILFHPAYATSESYRYQLDRNPENAVRPHEAMIFQDPEIRGLIAAQGIHLIGWKEIEAIYPWNEVRDF